MNSASSQIALSWSGHQYVTDMLNVILSSNSVHAIDLVEPSNLDCGTKEDAPLGEGMQKFWRLHSSKVYPNLLEGEGLSAAWHALMYSGAWTLQVSLNSLPGGKTLFKVSTNSEGTSVHLSANNSCCYFKSLFLSGTLLLGICLFMELLTVVRCFVLSQNIT